MSHSVVSASACNDKILYQSQSTALNTNVREHGGAEEVGKILIPTDQIMSGEPLEGWFPLIVSSGGAEQGAVHIAFQLFPPLALSVGKVLEGGYFQV